MLWGATMTQQEKQFKMQWEAEESHPRTNQMRQ
jgi:hypothetical protein